MTSGKIHILAYTSLNHQLLVNERLKLVLTCNHHTSVITNIKYSIKRNFIAIVDCMGKLTVRRRKNYELFLERTRMDSFAWHPWKETDLVTGE